MKHCVSAGVTALIIGGASILAACGSTGGAGSADHTGTPASTQSAATNPAVTSTPVPATTGTAPSTPAVAGAPVPCRSGTCWVDVSVATAWVKPWYPRAIDQPSLANPAFPDTWLRSLTVPQKAWLVGKLETQAVYGTQVSVTEHWGAWSHVTVSGQPTNRDSRGYPGWIPTVQLTGTAPAPAQLQAIVRTPSAWVWSGWSASGVAGDKIMLSSYDTSFPVVRAAARYVEVRLIGGRTAALQPADVVVHQAGTTWRPTSAKVLAEARRFLGLAYLWGGTSGFGLDCSGFTYSVYKAYGITLSRDADQQAVHGTAVARSSLQPGDLVFFRGSAGGQISHVGLYVGGGLMIDAPNTGSVVRTEPVWWSSYAGARRYLSG
jgi:gamma-D-glutamyl-L-lysine dipeptidyl-peptidase